MPNCKNCGTRYADRDKYCPNCGRTQSPGSSISGVGPLVDGSVTQPTEALKKTSNAGGGRAAPKVEPGSKAKSRAAAKPPAAKKPAKKAAAPEPEPESEQLEEELPEIDVPDIDAPEIDVPEVEVLEEMELSETADPLAQEDAVAEPTPSSLFSLQPEELRARIIERPEMIEAGLVVYTGGSDPPLGVEFSTDVGDIDLLAEGRDGALVVVRVVERGAGDPVGPVLEQLGWVSKHVAADSRPVRAIVLLEPPAAELGYAARAVAEQVAFKTWRVAVAVDDIEV